MDEITSVLRDINTDLEAEIDEEVATRKDTRSSQCLKLGEDATAGAGATQTQSHQPFSKDGESQEPRKKAKYSHYCVHCKKWSPVLDSDFLFHAKDTRAPEEQVFQNELLLTTILNKLSWTELKDARLINHFWNQNATALLLKSQSLKVRIYYPGYGGTHIVELNSNKSNQPLESLNECLKMSSVIFGEEKIPFNVVFLKEPDLDASDIQHFFVLHGCNIKYLKLHLQESTPISALKLLLVIQTPCLQSLYLENIPLSWTTRQVELFPEPIGFGGNIQLSCLRLLTLDSHCMLSQRVLQDFLRVATNLEEFKGFKEEYIRAFINSNKVHVIKELTFQPNCYQESLNLYQELGNSNMKIKRLSFYLRSVYDKPNAWPIVQKSLSQILQSSSDNLVDITVQPVGFMEAFFFPSLPNLTKMQVEVLYDKYNWRMVFPLGLKFTAAFPSLISFKVDIRRIVGGDTEGVNEGRDTFYEYFEDCEPHQNVKFFECGHHLSNFVLPAFWTEKFTKFFPFLQEANFGKISNFPLVAKSIWKVLTLKKLQISLDVGTVTFNDNEISLNGDEFAFDIAFTGLSYATCVELTIDGAREEVGGSGDPHRNYRESPSILDLKNLEALNLKFYDCFDDTLSTYESSVSKLTGIAFRACPNLYVSISVRPRNSKNVEEFKASLESIAPYVHSGP